MTKTRHITVLSYNLHFHAAYEEVFVLAQESGADIVCLQECNAKKLMNQIGDFLLAANTNSTNLGLAIYYRKERLRLVKHFSHHLPRSLYEKMAGWKHERALAVEFYDTYSKQSAFFVSFHATHLVASNLLRRRQLNSLLHMFDTAKSPVIIVGDYNYPLFHEYLRKYLYQRNFHLHVPTSATYKSIKFKGKFDLISTKFVSRVEMRVLPQGNSDHMAVHAMITYDSSDGGMF